jgi:hypothetical protein
MCDISTANCISQVIARRLSRDRGIRLVRHNKYRADLEIRGHRIPLSIELFKWLVAAETGGPVDAIEIVLNVPETGPATITVVRPASSPTAKPPQKFSASRKPARVRPIAPSPGSRCGKEGVHPEIAARANLIRVNEGRRAALKPRHERELEVADHLYEH